MEHKSDVRYDKGSLAPRCHSICRAKIPDLSHMRCAAQFDTLSITQAIATLTLYYSDYSTLNTSCLLKSYQLKLHEMFKSQFVTYFCFNHTMIKSANQDQSGATNYVGSDRSW